MANFENALLLLLLLTALTIVGRWLPWPMPITHVIGGTAAALWPVFPRIALDPGIFFLCFVPPLLYADGWLMPLRDFISAKRPILMLATGLVVFTTFSVGFVAHWLVPDLPLAMALALGALVSPTDAVAVSAITQRLKVPARLSVVLNGESLMNDATGLVGFKFALAAMVAGTFAPRRDARFPARCGRRARRRTGHRLGDRPRPRSAAPLAQRGCIHRGHDLAADAVCRVPRRRHAGAVEHSRGGRRRTLLRLA
jgi:CPA1 family monovalent cation:H+ antiporter